MRRQLWVCAGALLAVSSAFAAVKQFKPGWNLFSTDQDLQLGKEMAAKVQDQYEVVDDPEIQAYIDRIGKALATQPQAGKFPYTFKVVKDPSINAFALPGGPTFVNTGLIKAADSESQLVGVMAHEISHCALRHGTNQASKANLLQLPAALAGAVAGGTLMGQLAQAGIGLGLNSVVLKFSRSAESEADLNGAQMMAGAGYNPLDLAHFFEKLQAQGGDKTMQFFSDHPNPGNRMKAIQDQLQQMPQKSYTANTRQFNWIQGKVNALPPPKKLPQPAQVAQPQQQSK